MSFRSSCALVSVSLALLLGACQGSPNSASCPASCASPQVQSIVDAVGREHPEVVRLTVHAKGQGCDKYCVIASTLAAKVCKLSDPEDVEAMNTGKPVVIDEVGAVDVTVPVLKEGARCTATVGVTFEPNPEMRREQFVELAAAIAKVVEGRMRALPK
jgi:hypothetical protein